MLHMSAQGTGKRQIPLPLGTDASPAGSERTTNRTIDGIFGWYRYVQDFTGEFALEWLDRLAMPGDIVWDPFSGSGTTLVAAKLLHLDSFGYDISPFMTDVARTKVDWSIDPRNLEQALEQVETESWSQADEPSAPSSIPWGDYARLTTGLVAPPYRRDEKLRKWIAPLVLDRASALLGSINRVRDERARRFLRLAAASVLVSASNMEFRPNICYRRQPHIDFPVVGAFTDRSHRMIEDYALVATADNSASSVVSLGDARSAGPDFANFILTSPPYPNDMEYVHQTRLELILLDYIEDTKGLTALKKRMISSSVKLVYRSNEWQKKSGLEVNAVRNIYDDISRTLEGRNWGWNAADMTAQYFGGMRSVLANWAQRLAPSGRAAVVIGDSAFNGVKVPTDALLAECAEMEGLDTEDIQVFRKRWNTKHNIELHESVLLLRNRR